MTDNLCHVTSCDYVVIICLSVCVCTCTRACLRRTGRFRDSHRCNETAGAVGFEFRLLFLAFTHCWWWAALSCEGRACSSGSSPMRFIHATSSHLRPCLQNRAPTRIPRAPLLCVARALGSTVLTKNALQNNTQRRSNKAPEGIEANTDQRSAFSRKPNGVAA